MHASVRDEGGEAQPPLGVGAARAAGLTDAEIVEIISVVALNIFTNLIGKATHVDIDFPKVALLGAVERKAA